MHTSFSEIKKKLQIKTAEEKAPIYTFCMVASGAQNRRGVGVLHPQNSKYCLKVSPKIVVELQKVSD